MVESLKENLFARRPDFARIVELIPDNVKVLDLGCGNGALLKTLFSEKNAKGCGVEMDQDKIIESSVNGVPVIHQDLNDGLAGFPDASYDYVVLSQTLQAVSRPDELLEEMVRVGRKVIVSFINFGHYKVRLQLLFSGKMPVNPTLPDPWYDTPNIHLATLRDFRDLCRDKGLCIVREIPLGEGGSPVGRFHSNLFALTSVFVISKSALD